jgi:hypothetical protein
MTTTAPGVARLGSGSAREVGVASQLERVGDRYLVEHGCLDQRPTAALELRGIERGGNPDATDQPGLLPVEQHQPSPGSLWYRRDQSIEESTSSPSPSSCIATRTP